MSEPAAARTMQSGVSPRFGATSLAVEGVGINDNFFDLWGHSLLAVRLFTALEKEFGRTLPLSALFEGPTIAKLAALLDESLVSTSSVVAIQREGSNPPLFFVHGADGEVLVFRGLARQLGADQPFFGLRPHELEEASAEPVPVEVLAAHYVKAILPVAGD